MKILLCAPQDQHTHLYLGRALKRLNHDVDEFDYRANNAKYGPYVMNKRLVMLAASYDLVIVMKGETVYPATLRETKAVLINWDSWYAFAPVLLDGAFAARLFLTPSAGLIEEYKKRGIWAEHFLEGADLELHHGMPMGGFVGSDCSFIGTVEGIEGRDEWLRDIGKRFDLKIFGSFPGPLSRQWHTGKRAAGEQGEDFAHNLIVSATKVNLDRTRTPDIEGCISARVFRTMAANGFLLMVAQKGLEKYIPSDCVATYHDTSECIEKIERYLAEDDERMAVAKRGYDWVAKNGTWDIRAEQLLKLVGKT